MEKRMSTDKADVSNLPSRNDQRLFRTVAALGAELRKQGAFAAAENRIDLVDLVDLAYAALAVADGRSPQHRGRTR